jgi:hypothetical protein
VTRASPRASAVRPPCPGLSACRGHRGASAGKDLASGDDGGRRGAPPSRDAAGSPLASTADRSTGAALPKCLPPGFGLSLLLSSCGHDLDVRRHLSDRFLRASLTRRGTDFLPKGCGGLMPKKGQRRGPSCASLQFASCSEGLASGLVSGQTLGSSGRHAAYPVGRPAIGGPRSVPAGRIGLAIHVRLGPPQAQ